MIKLFTLFFILQTILAQEKFNIFKSYADSKVKPPQYSRVKKHLRHSIDEYLNPVQKKMYKIRHSNDTPNVMFDSKWSGFDLKTNSKWST
jgi:hypothetical protein